VPCLGRTILPPDIFHHLPALRVHDVGDRHPGALRCQNLAGRLSDPSGPAGHDGDLAIHTSHGPPPFAFRAIPPPAGDAFRDNFTLKKSFPRELSYHPLHAGCFSMGSIPYLPAANKKHFHLGDQRPSHRSTNTALPPFTHPKRPFTISSCPSRNWERAPAVVLMPNEMRFSMRLTNDLRMAMQGHIPAQAELMGPYVEI
jgi:hypothetical protein